MNAGYRCSCTPVSYTHLDVYKRQGVCRNAIVLIRLASYYFLYFIAFDLDVTCKWLAADAVENAAAFQYNIHISPPFRVWGFWLVIGDWLEFGCLELVVMIGG